MAGSAWTNQVQNLVIIGGAGAGLFVYSGPPGLGNPPIFWATSASTDPFGNAIPSTSGVAGTGIFRAGNEIINPSGEFVYSATPAAGNLLMSFSPVTGTDSFGNHYVAGSWIYGATTGIGISSGTHAVATLTGSLAAGWVIASILSSNGTTTFLTASAAISLSSGTGSASLTTSASAPLTVQGPSGLSGAVPLVQADISTNAVGNTGTAGELTKLWSIPANDGITGTTYTIRALATMTTGPTTIETITIGADINNGVGGGGTLVPLATLGTAFNGGALSTTYAIPLELTLIVNAAGVSTPEIYLSGPLGDTSANRLATNSANMAGFSHAAAWNPTNLNTLSIYAQWGGAGGAGQTIGTIASRLYRDGP